MKEITDALTPEQQEALRNIYVIIVNGIYPIVKDNAPTADTLKVIARIDTGNVCVYTAEDFLKDKDGDFYVKGKDVDLILRKYTPAEVTRILDNSNSYELYIEAMVAIREEG